jgi:hypothetical protein
MFESRALGSGFDNRPRLVARISDGLHLYGLKQRGGRVVTKISNGLHLDRFNASRGRLVARISDGLHLYRLRPRRDRTGAQVDEGIHAGAESPVTEDWIYADSHFHPTNYVGQGGDFKDIIDNYMGSIVGRSTLMPIPLAQMWDHCEHFADGATPPTYYLGPKADLYYYSYIDSMVASEYNKLSESDKQRLDPMITAFNPMDLYAVQHIKRALLTNPGVFSGIGEFTVHKEVVSAKTDKSMTLQNPSLSKILDFAAESGLVVVLHNDIYGAEVTHDGKVLSTAADGENYVQGLKDLGQASPDAKVIWAHTGLGRFVSPTADHLKLVASVLDACPNWRIDLSWDLVQHYILHPEAGQPSTSEWVDFLTKYQDRVLFGSDNVFYKGTTVNDGDVTEGRRQNVNEYLAVAKDYQPLWDLLGPTVARKIQRGNYETLYDTARANVRAWEAAHKDDDIWSLAP